MKKRTLLCGSLLMLLVFTGVTYAQPSKHTLLDIASRYFTLVKEQDFNSASKLFHYPENYSKQELIDDMNAVSKLLSFLANEFGNVDPVNISEKPALFYNVLAGGGDVPYWQKHPYSTKLTYEVYFEKEGRGYVALTFCNINGSWEIRQVAYGLPASRSDSRTRVLTILREMMQFMQQSEEKQKSSI